MKKLISKMIYNFIILFVILNITTVSATLKGDIRVIPQMNIKFQTPVYFSVEVIGDKVAYDPIIFLVMTEESYEGLTKGVDVIWADGGVTFEKEDFIRGNNDSALLPPEAVSEIKYSIALLREQLNADGPIYWVSQRFLGDLVDFTPKEFIVTLHSTKPNMVVYVLGKSSLEIDEYDMRSMVVDSRDIKPQFHVPEPMTILGLGASITALSGYVIKKKKGLKFKK